jgi:hypothetical protein
MRSVLVEVTQPGILDIGSELQDSLGAAWIMRRTLSSCGAFFHKFIYKAPLTGV